MHDYDEIKRIVRFFFKKITLYDWSLLNNRDISNKYSITQRNEFDALPEISETLTPNENHVNDHMQAVVKYIQTKLRAKHKDP